ncbi:MAG: hypothetical protein IJ804_08020 [Prevotella sp.]|nr:hypothetical protein [Prevotella sp.]
MPSLTYQEIYELLTTVRDERRTHANTATRVGEAMLALLAYMANAPYLRKDQADATNYLLSLLAGAVVGESGQIRLNPDGSIICSRIHVNGSAIFDELVFNKQSATAGDQIFTDRGIIDHLMYLGDNQFRLTMRKEYENDVTTFKVHDCLKCRVNRLDKDGTYFTSWFRVLSVDYEANTLDVIMYPDEEVPGGQNYAPVESAVAARWGNPVDEERQRSFYLSATDGTFCFLQKVTKPIIDVEGEGNNTAAFIGLPPDIPEVQALVKAGILKEDETVLYAKTLLYGRLQHINLQGVPDYIIREHESWDEETQYIKDWDAVEEGYFQDAAWHGGSLWYCVVKKARIGVAPSLLNTDWVCVRSSGLVLEIESTEGDFFRAGTDWETTLVAMVTHGDLIISDNDIESIVWTRESGDAAGDEAWNINQAKKTQTMQLTVRCSVDVPQPWTYKSKVGFRCTVRYANKPITNSYDIQ